MASRESSLISDVPSSSIITSSEASEPASKRRRRQGPRSKLWALFREADLVKGEKKEDAYGNTMYYYLHYTNWEGSSITRNARLHMKMKHPQIPLPDEPES